MKTYPILIITEEYDSHVDDMLLLLREMGQEPARVHTADLPQHTGLSLSYDGASWKNTLQTRTRTIPLEEVRSIWWRRPAAIQLPETLTLDEEAFVRSEVTQAFTGMWEMLEHTCYWVSFPANIRKASHKISQLELATRLGLQVPHTLVSTDPDGVRTFYEACHRQMIYKTLGNPQPTSLRIGSSMAEQRKYSLEHPEDENCSRFIYTTLLREQDLALLDTIRLAPGFFQEYIPKRVELRVTVIGNEIFTAELHSQVHEQTRYDWRHYEVEVPMHEHQLPVEVAEQCLALTKAYGLSFSTSDLIVTPEGRYVFLEMNPNGQFLWVQDRVPTLHLREAMAACLIRGSNA
jgi:glutathione synthase/RimK-type ligase-like ATP-grasp enzyme